MKLTGRGLFSILLFTPASTIWLSVISWLTTFALMQNISSTTKTEVKSAYIFKFPPPHTKLASILLFCFPIGNFLPEIKWFPYLIPSNNIPSFHNLYLCDKDGTRYGRQSRDGVSANFYHYSISNICIQPISDIRYFKSVNPNWYPIFCPSWYLIFYHLPISDIYIGIRYLYRLNAIRYRCSKKIADISANLIYQFTDMPSLVNTLLSLKLPKIMFYVATSLPHANLKVPMTSWTFLNFRKLQFIKSMTFYFVNTYRSVLWVTKQ